MSTTRREIVAGPQLMELLDALITGTGADHRGKPLIPFDLEGEPNRDYMTINQMGHSDEPDVWLLKGRSIPPHDVTATYNVGTGKGFIEHHTED